MGSLSVIIPSKTRANVDACVAAVSRHEPDARIFVVDDGVDWSARTLQTIENNFHCAFEILPGKKPFIFSRNVNAGIEAAGGDVVLLNDDALLQTDRGFSIMQEEAIRNPQWGVIAASCNGISVRQARVRESGMREDARMVAFVCVFLPRSTIDQVGLLDERFTAYGFEDDDYCLRVRRAGLKIGICDGCFVDHASLKSTFRGMPYSPVHTLKPGKQIFIEKWGAYPL